MVKAMDPISPHMIEQLRVANIPTGPFVIFIARSSKCHNGATIHGQKMWLRGTMSYVESAFRSKYGYLGNRPQAYCTFVHESNDPLPPTDDGIQYISAVMQRAQEAGTQAIIVISGWDGFTTDEPTFINLLRDFKEVKITIRIYASFMRDSPRHFWEVDAHKVSAYFEGKLTLEDDTEKVHSALFAERFRFIHGERASIEEAVQMLMKITGKSREELMEECRLEAEGKRGETEYEECEVFEEMWKEEEKKEEEIKEWRPRRRRKFK
jgi:hypothetical protein